MYCEEIHFLSSYYFLTESVILYIVNGLARGILASCLSVVSLDMLGTTGFATGLGLILCVGGIFVVASGPITGEFQNKNYHIVTGNTASLAYISLVTE